MRRFCELLFGKAAVVGFMLWWVARPKPPRMTSSQPDLLYIIDRAQYPYRVNAYWFRVFGS